MQKNRNLWTKPTASDEAFRTLPIEFHPGVEDNFEWMAEGIGMSPGTLHEATIDSIRTQHHRAFIKHPSYRAHDRFPDIFMIPMASFEIFFSVNTSSIQIHGYGWELDHEPEGDFDGGFVCL